MKVTSVLMKRACCRDEWVSIRAVSERGGHTEMGRGHWQKGQGSALFEQESGLNHLGQYCMQGTS